MQSNEPSLEQLLQARSNGFTSSNDWNGWHVYAVAVAVSKRAYNFSTEKSVGNAKRALEILHTLILPVLA